MHVVRPGDADEVMDFYIERDMQDRDPYWAIVWASAIAMSELLQREPELVRGKRVAEIGCGLGIAGIAAAMAGAKEVVLMDREACALQCALMTATASGVPAQSAGLLASSDSERERIVAFEARCREGAAQAPAATCKVQVAPFDWTLPFEDQPFDVVIACDVLYENFSVEPLATVIPAMLGNRSLAQSVLLTDPPTRAPENRQRFMELIAEKDPDMMVRINKIASPVHEGSNVNVQLIALQRRVGGQTVGLSPLSVK